MPPAEWIVLGLMSGTSMDGIDVAAVRTDGRRVAPLMTEGKPLWATYPYEPALRGWLAATVAAPGRAEARGVRALEVALTEAHAAAVRHFLLNHMPPDCPVDLVGFHGHTLLHQPDRRLTRQLGDGARLAERLGLDVVSDFRSTDVGAGGQGAPLAPLYHQALAGGLGRPLAVLNLGGVGNVTWLGAGEAISAFDTGPGNALLDDWAARCTGRPCDVDGALARAGRVDAGRLAHLLDHPFFDRTPPKSLDRNDFSLSAVADLPAEDGAATLAAFTAGAVARALPHLPEAPRRWLVTGGGRHNPVLMAMLAERLGVPVEPVEAVGWQGDALEAQAFAFLAARAVLGLPLSLPETTGVPRPTTGGLWHRARSAAVPLRPAVEPEGS